MAAHLSEQGHALWLVSYDRGYRNLKDDFRVFETEGLSIASDDNRVSLVQTFTENLARLPEGHRKLQQLRKQLFHEFKPDCVITDFEPMTAYLANHYDLPLITIDNQHRMRYVKYTCPENLEFESHVAKNVIRAMVPRPDVSLVTVFAEGERTNDRTFLFPPILRREVLERRSRDETHVLVYATSAFESLIEMLYEFPRESFFVYGADQEGRRENVTFKPFSTSGFLSDLSACKAVVATAGFTLISESLYLKKPYLALPMQGQFEQQLNGFQLARLGFGKSADAPNSEALGDFLYRLPDYRSQLSGYHAGDNSEIKAKLEELLADNGRQVRDYHENRS